MPEVDPVQQHLQLLTADLSDLFLALRPGKPISFQALMPQTEPVAIPVQALQDPPIPIAEQE